MDIVQKRINDCLQNNSLKLDLSNLNLEYLPNLPENLIELYCDQNQLILLPDNLPKNLCILNCSFNKLKFLPNLPNNLEYLYCNNNNLLSLPNEFPNTIKGFDCRHNNLKFLPYINNKNIKGYIVGNELPNRIPGEGFYNYLYRYYKITEENSKNCIKDRSSIMVYITI
jgi:Leucine-rich repeat (LRR) protein|uniref:Leucine-rich repeat protein n=1 Tax=viral metagenome TaxID=1070528 RepID=A0A6C0H1A6_9ZZZZ